VARGRKRRLDGAGGGTASAFAGTAAGWDGFFTWQQRFAADPHYLSDASEELNGWAQTSNAALRMVASDRAGWQDGLKTCFKAQSAVSHFSWRAFLEFCNHDPAAARAAIETLVMPADRPVSERVDAFAAAVPNGEGDKKLSPGAKLGIASFLLLGSDPQQYAVFQPGLEKAGVELAEFPACPKNASLGGRYDHYLDLLDDLQEQADDRRIPMPGRNAAYWALLWVGKGDAWFRQGYGPAWSPEQIADFEHYLGERREAAKAAKQTRRA
jgi:hypothetical protein